MVQRSAVGLCLLLVLAGCARTRPSSTPTVVVVGAVSASAVDAPSESLEYTGAWKAKDQVEVEWRGDWWPASVVERRGPRWLVHYDGYGSEWDEAVGIERIRERRAEPELDSQDDSDEEPDP